MNGLIAFSLIALAACGGRRVDQSATPDAGGGGTFQSFPAVTRGAAYVDDGQGYHYDLSLMVTDASAAIGCSLVDPSASPGQPVSRVSFTLLSNAGERAPVCGPRAQAIGSSARGRFERWDANGTKTDTLSAVGGAASFASSSAGAGLLRCDVMVTLTFPGGAVFTDSFSYNYDSNDAITKSCLEADACSCKPWQSCDAHDKCVDPACVPSETACPADGSVACCQGTCTNGACPRICADAGTACDPSANNCCYSCDYLNNAVYHGWYCTHP